MNLKTLKSGFWKVIILNLIIVFYHADLIIVTKGCGSRTGESLQILFQLLTDTKIDYLKEISSEIILKNLFNFDLSKVNN